MLKSLVSPKPYTTPPIYTSPFFPFPWEYSKFPVHLTLPQAFIVLNFRVLIFSTLTFLNNLPSGMFMVCDLIYLRSLFKCQNIMESSSVHQIQSINHFPHHSPFFFCPDLAVISIVILHLPYIFCLFVCFLFKFVYMNWHVNSMVERGS